MTRVVAAVVAAVALTGCASAEDDRRSDVNEYIERVNALERQAAVAWNEAGTAYAALARGSVSKSQLRALDEAPKAIRSLRARIAAVQPPEDARRLRSELLRLLGMNARFAEEVSLFGHYVRAIGPLEQMLRTTTARLRVELRRSEASGSQQSALTVYSAQLGRLVPQLRRLRPPPALVSWHTGRVGRVVTLRDAARGLAAGLAANDQIRAERALATFTGAAASSGATAADRRAIVAYNARLKRIRAVAAAVRREQRRLVRELT